MENYDVFKLIDAANNDINFTLTLKLDSKSSNTIVRNIYESFRMLGESLLLSKNIKSFDHKEMIKVLIELNKNESLLKLHNLRELRHKINHKGYSATVDEAKEFMDLAEQSFNRVYEKVKKYLEDFSV